VSKRDEFNLGPEHHSVLIAAGDAAIFSGYIRGFILM
jgi:hypothetical protein